MSAKEELHRLVDTLRENQAARLLDEPKLRGEIDHADEQLSRGEFTDYDETKIADLAEAVKTRGSIRLAEERNKPVQ